MRSALRWLLVLVLLLPLILIAAVGGALVALNSKPGRDFAVRQINRISGGEIVVSGLGGHFPMDLKLASLEVADSRSVWLTATGLELRWLPTALLRRQLHITSLTARTLNIARAPVASAQPSATAKSSPGPVNLHHFSASMDRFAIDQLHLGAALAGRPVQLTVTGKARLASLTMGSASLHAVAAHGQGDYSLAAALDKRVVDVRLHIAEPPDGLLDHYAGRQLHQALLVDLSLAGPRDASALNFSASLGRARLNATGTLNLDPQALQADIIVNLPSLAPLDQLAKLDLGGTARLHLMAALENQVAKVNLVGAVALTQAPEPALKLTGGKVDLSLRLRYARNAAEIRNLTIGGTEFNVAVSGTLTQSRSDLKAHLDLKHVSDLFPGLSGSIASDGIIAGRPSDFAVHATISGIIKQKQVPSGPFALILDAQHLPEAPRGTLKGSGALENAPLAVNASFAREADGAATVHIPSATWRSIDLTADLALAPGTLLPTGAARFSILRMADLDAFLPTPLSGSIRGDFSHRNAQVFGLHVSASSLNVSPSIGTINGQVSAVGPIADLAFRINARLARLSGAPLQAATSGRIDGNTRSVNLASLQAAWKSLNVSLLAPASFDTTPDLIVHHLALGVSGGTIRLNGRLTPKLDFTLGIAHLPARLAEIASPGLAVSGSLDADAQISGSSRAPVGKISLRAAGIQLHSGMAEALPPAHLAADIALAGNTAQLKARLNAGSDAQISTAGLVPLNQTGPVNLKLAGVVNLRILDPVLAAEGTTIRGVLTPDFTVTGTPQSPSASGTLALAQGAVQNIASGLNLLNISTRLSAANRLVRLENFSATAGQGTISGHGTIDLGQPVIPLNIVIDAQNATPVSSDLVTETLDATLHLTGAVKAAMKLAGVIDIQKANINIPKSLPPSVVNLPIYRPGEKPPPPPDIALDLLIHARNQVFIRGDGLFAELGGRVDIGGTAANPLPNGGFTLIRGNFSLGSKTLQFTKGVVSFNGAGFMPTLDLEATTYTTNNDTATLIVGGTAAKPTITLTGSPPLPSDEILSQLLFGQSTSSLSPFQAASLAAALASLSGVGGDMTGNPLGGVRRMLGLDELSLGGGSGGAAPSIQAGRYVAPGVFVGAQQSTSGAGTQATVQVNLYKGLKLQTQTGASSSGVGDASSVGLTYEFNY